MRNEFYHAFRVGFNWWMVAAGVLVILAAIIGARRPVNQGGRLRHRFRKEAFNVYAFIAASGWGVMFAVESHRGVLQFFDNAAARDDSPFYALIGAGCALLVVPFLFGLILYQIERLAYLVAFGRICEEIINLRRANKRRQKAVAEYNKERRREKANLIARSRAKSDEKAS